ncbi:MAG: arsenic efflux protein [Bacteroidales bacterium]|nr:arsenic efflux protein [Bacteroidales bacterium]
MAFLELVWDVFYEDCLILFPILFLTFFFIEYLEHRAGEKFLRRVERAEKTGPLWGALIGCVPQCGFSVSCAHLFNGGIVTAGTLVAVFLSTSDEALPVLLSHRSALPVIWKLLLVKVILAVVAGYTLDFIWKREQQHQSFAKKNIEHECHIKESSIGELLRESLKRTIEVWIALFIVSIVLTFVMENVPKESVQKFLLTGAFQPFLDALARDWEPQGRTYFQPVDFAPDQGVAHLLVRNLAEDFNTLGLLCSLIVFFFLWISLGSLELSLMSFLPLAVGWIWILGMMGLTGLQFNIVNIILATFIFGQGDDYTIFMTEGLMYEYATGKKILHSYKNSVMLSGLIMFIGIGVLVVARHPAMRSLGLVTIIGMMTVVAMAYILPPLVFRFLTRRHGALRTVPLTLWGILGTLYLMIQMVFWMTLLSVLTVFIPKGAFFHRIIRRVAQAAIHLIPGCRYTCHNPHGEDFSKPAVYICNHQSHLDVLALIALHPKLIFMTNDWVWKFPFYGAVIRKAGYFPVSRGLSENNKHIQDWVSRGYSVVFFPEGTRSIDGSIQRFHRGAFLTARELGLEVVPLCIHGFSYALPKRNFFLRRAPLYLEIGQRAAVPKEADIVRMTREMMHFYVDWYARIRRERETAAFFAPFVRLEYLYKGHDTQWECRRVFRPEVYRQIDALTGPEIVLENAGCGVRALLTALTHPDKTVIAHIADEESYLTATRCRLPKNLHYVQD